MDAVSCRVVFGTVLRTVSLHVCSHDVWVTHLHAVVVSGVVVMFTSLLHDRNARGFVLPSLHMYLLPPPPSPSICIHTSRPAMSFSIFMLTLEALILILTCLLICHNPRDRTKDLLVKTFVRRAGERWEVSGPSTGKVPNCDGNSMMAHLTITRLEGQRPGENIAMPEPHGMKDRIFTKSSEQVCRVHVGGRA